MEDEIPQPLIEAAQKGTLVVFAGAGLSATKNMPSWRQLAENALKDLAKKRKISYAEAEQLKTASPRTILSFVEIICEGNGKNFVAQLMGDIEQNEEQKRTDGACKNYENLWKISQRFVTTNYDSLIESNHPSRQTSLEEGEDDKGENNCDLAVFKEDDFSEERLAKGDVVFHLHGSTREPRTMVFSTDHYLKLYGSYGRDEDLRKSFVKKLFKDEQYTFLFIGYSLEELEILEYIITKASEKDGSEQSEKAIINKYIIQGFFSYEGAIKTHMELYWKDLGIKAIFFEKDERNYEELYNVIDKIAHHTKPMEKRLEFSKMLNELREAGNE